jgi:hypothetical protein
VTTEEVKGERVPELGLRRSFAEGQARPAAGEVAILDLKQARLPTTWRLTGYGADCPMALDEPRHRLFVGYRRPASVLFSIPGLGEDCQLSRSMVILTTSSMTRRLGNSSSTAVPDSSTS